MPHQAIRRIALTIALAALPGMAGVAWAAGSQAGDNGRQPIGADTDSPRQAIPNATTNDANGDYTTTAYYGGVTTYPSYGYRQEMIDEHPAYLTYYYTSPPVTDEYSPGWRGYYRYAYPGDTSDRNTNTSPRCEPLSGAAYVDCLHGAAPGGGQ
jgi:hypothetical protein